MLCGTKTVRKSRYLIDAMLSNAKHLAFFQAVTKARLFG
jgi:hypothetical protein